MDQQFLRSVSRLGLFVAAVLLVPVARAQHPGGARPDALPRIGREISADERAYFGLFRRITAFRSASIERIDATHVSFRIERDAATDTTVVVDAGQLSVLAAYIEDFERLMDDQLRGRIPSRDDWKQLAGLAAPRSNLYKRGRIIQAFVYGSPDPIAGRLLYAGDEVLVLTEATSLVAAVSRPSLSVVVPVRRIQRLVIGRGFWQRISLRSNILINGSVARYQTEALPELTRKGMFFHMLAPELNAFVAEQAASRDDGPVADAPRVRRRAGRIHVFLAKNVRPFTNVASFPTRGYVHRDSGRVVFGDMPFSLGLGYDLTSRVRSTVHLTRLSPPTVDQMATQETYSGYYLDFSARYLIARTRRFNPYEISAGIGGRIARFRLASQLVADFPERVWKDTSTRTLYTLGANATLGIAYALSSRLSVGAEATAVVHKDMNIPKQNMMHPNGTILLRGKEPRTLSLATCELLFGLQLHL